MNTIKFNRPANRNANWFNLIDEVLSPVHRSAATSFSGSSPAINIIEAEGNYTIELAAPGLKKEDFEIKIEKDQLLINTKVEEQAGEKKEDYKRREFSFKNFKRSFHLNENLDGEKIEASYEAGILSINIPKKEEAIIQPKLITIN